VGVYGTSGHLLWYYVGAGVYGGAIYGVYVRVCVVAGVLYRPPLLLLVDECVGLAALYYLSGVTRGPYPYLLSIIHILCIRYMWGGHAPVCMPAPHDNSV